MFRGMHTDAVHAERYGLSIQVFSLFYTKTPLPKPQLNSLTNIVTRTFFFKKNKFKFVVFLLKGIIFVRKRITAKLVQM